jgi:hypothetical protein
MNMIRLCIIVGMNFYCNLSVGYGWVPGWLDLSMLGLFSSSRNNLSFGVDMDLVLDYRHCFFLPLLLASAR